MIAGTACKLFEATLQLRDAQLVLNGRTDGLQVQVGQLPQLHEQIRLPGWRRGVRLWGWGSPSLGAIPQQ